MTDADRNWLVQQLGTARARTLSQRTDVLISKTRSYEARRRLAKAHLDAAAMYESALSDLREEV